MMGSDLSCYALSGCVAAAMLTGCGGSQPPTGPLGVQNFTLTGETFSSDKAHSFCNEGRVVSTFYITVDFKASGNARGPFPGEFTARGFAQITVPRNPKKTAYVFHETFKVTSGSKEFSGLGGIGKGTKFALTCRHSDHNRFSVSGIHYKVDKMGGTARVILNERSFTESFK